VQVTRHHLVVEYFYDMSHGQGAEDEPEGGWNEPDEDFVKERAVLYVLEAGADLHQEVQHRLAEGGQIGHHDGEQGPDTSAVRLARRAPTNGRSGGLPQLQKTVDAHQHLDDVDDRLAHDEAIGHVAVTLVHLDVLVVG